MSNEPSAIQVIGPAAGEAIIVLGAPVVIKSNGCAGPLFFADHVAPPGHHVPPHIHADEDELFYILEGELSLVGEAGAMTAGPGSLVHLPRGVMHGFGNDTDKPVRMLVVTSGGGGLEGVFRDLDAAAKEADLAPDQIGAICAANRVYMQ